MDEFNEMNIYNMKGKISLNGRDVYITSLHINFSGVVEQIVQYDKWNKSIKWFITTSKSVVNKKQNFPRES